MATIKPIITFPVFVSFEDDDGHYYFADIYRRTIGSTNYDTPDAYFHSDEAGTEKCYTNPGDTKITVSPDKKVLTVKLNSAVYQTQSNPSGTLCTGYLTVAKTAVQDSFRFDWKTIARDGSMLSAFSGDVVSGGENTIKF